MNNILTYEIVKNLQFLVETIKERELSTITTNDNNFSYVRCDRNLTEIWLSLQEIKKEIANELKT